MCGILAVIHSHPLFDTSAAAELHDALYILQHRGQDACGIVTCASGGKIFQNKGNGLAANVFQNGSRVTDLPGYMGLGHLRYPTAGTSVNAEAQPFYVNSPYGICFAHNGNLVNAPELKRFLDREAHRHINTESDSELMLNVFANELNETKKARVNAHDCFAALERMYKRCNGGWACTAMIAGYGLIGFRDSYGIRPMVLGSKPSEGGKGGTDYMMASESVVLTSCGYKNIIDILPGQAVLIERGKSPIYQQVERPKAYAPDIFEYVYFARPESLIDNISVYRSRQAMGVSLARKIRRDLPAEILDSIDVVIPIPETSLVSAHSLALDLGLPYCQAFVKNRYIFRTFIMPSQEKRLKGVRAKLNAIKHEFEGRNVLLIDDSIVRGTTSREIVTMAREAGAHRVVFASCAPPITNAHIYGIDLASPSELIAHSRSELEIAALIGADAVIYQSLPDLERAVASLSPRPGQRFEVGVFCGSYVTPIGSDYFDQLERVRGRARTTTRSGQGQAQPGTNGAGAHRDRALLLGGKLGEAALPPNLEVKPVGIVRSHSMVNAANLMARVNGMGIGGDQGRRSEEERGTREDAELDGHVQVRVQDSQDISLHNFHDHA